MTMVGAAMLDCFFFFQAEDGIRDIGVTGVQTCALPIYLKFNINGKGMIAKSRYADGGAIGAARYMDPTKPVRANGNDIYTKYFGGYAQWYTASTFKDSAWLQTSNRNATGNPDRKSVV